MTDDVQRARRRAHNAHALERCNAMGRTAGSILWQPLENRAGKWFMPDGSELVEAPIEWRSERLSTILDEMDERQAVAPVVDAANAYINGLDVEKWKAEADAIFPEPEASSLRLRARKAGEEITEGQPVTIGSDGMVHVVGPFTPEPEMTYTIEGYHPGSVPTPSRALYEALTRPVPPPSTISLEDLEKTISKPAGMKFWFDTEFIEDGKTIDLVSIGVVSEDGRTYYAETNDWIPGKASQWVKDNVLVHLYGGAAIKPRDVIARELVEFMGEKPEIWAYYADYDWVVLCQIFGTMMQLPEGWPMYCRDLKQMVDSIGNLSLPPQSTVEHHALEDAIWTKRAWLHASQWVRK